MAPSMWTTIILQLVCAKTATYAGNMVKNKRKIESLAKFGLPFSSVYAGIYRMPNSMQPNITEQEKDPSVLWIGTLSNFALRWLCMLLESNRWRVHRLPPMLLRTTTDPS